MSATSTASRKHLAEKKPRMREVYDTSEVPHKWAHQTQPHARNKQGNLYFRDSTIYSYGEHFPVARFTEHRGKRCVLLTMRSCSHTTAGHIGAVRCAVPAEIPTFHVPDLSSSSWGALEISKDTHDTNWKDYLERITKQAGIASRARKRRDRELTVLQSLITEANAYSTFFGLRKRVAGGSDLEKLIEEMATRQAEIRKAELKRVRDAQIKRDAELAESLQTWLRGENPYRSLFDLSKTYLRIREYPNNPELETDVETSKGARFPVAHAVKLWSLLKRLHDAGETYQHNGHSLHLGDYRIDNMDAQGTIKAGCHTVEWSEVERIAGLLGLS